MQRQIEMWLAAWNVKQIESLLEVYEQYASSDGFWVCLPSICRDQELLQRAASWLIKHHYDEGHRLAEQLENELLGLCGALQHWEAKLHLLQLLPYFKLAQAPFRQLDLFLSECLKSENTFVRAWAYQGYYELSKSYPELISELKAICETAMETESASIKAKVRKILSHISR